MTLRLLTLLFLLCAAAGPALGAPDLAPATGAPGARVDPGEVTFIVAADTHLGFPGMEKANRRIIAHMNQLPGKPWPAPLGGRVATPQGVFIAGDLTNDGTWPQWRLFQKLYGRTGRDGLLRFPVFEGTGNHDRPKRGVPYVPLGVAKRHGRLLYSHMWSGVRFVNLDIYPSRGALAFLKRDLRGLPASTPLVIFFHYNLWGPYSHFWSERERQAFATALAGRNVLALFHGHFHADGYYQWKGFQVYNVGSPRHPVHTFCVVRITAANLDVAAWDWDEGRFTWWHRRPRRPKAVASSSTGQP